MLGLSLLLNTAATALDQLCIARMSHDVGVLTPEYLDPSLHLALEGTPDSDATAARQRLGHIAGQLQAVGPLASTRAILERPETSRRRTALLALAGATAWQLATTLPGGGQLHCRPAADGQVYLLAGAPGAGAAHAPHAVRDYAERLWLLPADHPCANGSALPQEAAALHSNGAADSLSIDAALRDLVVTLQQQGAADVAGQVLAVRQGEPLPVTLTRPALPLAPAAAA